MSRSGIRDQQPTAQTRGAAQASRWDVDPIDADPATDTAAEPGPAITPTVGGIFVPPPTGDTTPVVTWRPGGRHLFTWVGAHGGSGATSLARASGQGAELTKVWPNGDLGWPSAAVVVCRSNASGLDAAARLIQEARSRLTGHLEHPGHPGHVNVIALAVVADAPGRLPKALRHRIHELSGLVPLVVQVPWISEWRETPHAPHEAATAAAHQIATALQASADLAAGEESA